MDTNSVHLLAIFTLIVTQLLMAFTLGYYCLRKRRLQQVEQQQPFPGITVTSE